MERRIVEVVEPCEKHGVIGNHYPPGAREYSDFCSDTTRRVLTEGQYVLIEKVDGEWPEENREPIMEMLHEKDGPLPEDAYQLTDMGLWARVVGYRVVAIPLDALSDHTEGTP